MEFKTYYGASARLLKAVPNSTQYDAAKTVLDCIENGFIVWDVEKNTYVPALESELFDILVDSYGFAANQWNKGLHKSYATVARADVFNLFLEQIVHYISVYDFNTTFIPMEEIDKDVEIPRGGITIIPAVNQKQLYSMFLDRLEHLMKPNAQQVVDTTAIAEYLGWRAVEGFAGYQRVKSFELRAALYLSHKEFPTDPNEGLRVIIYRLTGSTLVIKNRELIDRIKCSNRKAETYLMLDKIPTAVWAEIFHKRKPLFLAMKPHPWCRTRINRIRRLADVNHRPESDMNTRNFTNLCYQGRMEEAIEVANAMNNRDLVKVMNAIAYKLTKEDDMMGVYSIRNGKNYINAADRKMAEGEAKNLAAGFRVLDTTLKQRLSEKLNGKIFIIPEYVDYAIPISEKQMVGAIPWGSRFFPKGDEFVIGVSWENYKTRTDIDLHMTGLHESFGWNSGWRNTRAVHRGALEKGGIVYSGDIVDAANGATEAFLVHPAEDSLFLVGAHLFAGTSGTPYRFCIGAPASENPIAEHNHIFDSPLFPPVPLKFEGDKRDNTLGLLYGDTFMVFGGALAGRSQVPNHSFSSYLKSILGSLDNRMLISELFAGCGARVVESIDELTDEEKETAVDLSPYALAPNTLTDIIDGNID